MLFEQLVHYSRFEIIESNRYQISDEVKYGRVSYACNSFQEKFEEQETPELKRV